MSMFGDASATGDTCEGVTNHYPTEDGEPTEIVMKGFFVPNEYIFYLRRKDSQVADSALLRNVNMIK